nr:hypothetical protein [Candidatus Goldiibacteriota bacterium]
IHYRTDGTPYNVIIYTGGNMEESTEYRDNGKPLKTIKYKIGEIIQYDENGEIAGKEPFETNIYDEYGEY